MTKFTKYKPLNKFSLCEHMTSMFFKFDFKFHISLLTKFSNGNVINHLKVALETNYSEEQVISHFIYNLFCDLHLKTAFKRL